MSQSYWGYWLVVFGVAIIGLMISVQGLTTTNNQDYNSIKEITDASMLDAVDYAYYREYNEVKIDKEKFMEVFIRRIAESMGTTDTYEVNFYEIYEAPPKVSVEIKSNSGANFTTSTDYDVINRVDAIIQVYAESGELPPSSGGEEDPGEEPETPPYVEIPEEIACKKGIAPSGDLYNKNIKGVSLKKGVASYNTLVDAKKGKSSSTAPTPGEIFTILGEDTSGSYWAIQTSTSECSWVPSKNMGINMKQYNSNFTYNITNRTGSVFNVMGQDIPNVTGKVLYSSEFNSFVPLAYPFAKLLKYNVVVPSGYNLVIYDAYRPNSVGTYVGENITSAIPAVKNGSWLYDPVYNYTWSKAWFINTKKTSRHNYGCAVDLALIKSNGESDYSSSIHDLSVKAVKYQSGSSSEFHSNYSNSSYAQKLHWLMMVDGVEDLKSEWWHFQYAACSSLGNDSNNFWTNVN